MQVPPQLLAGTAARLLLALGHLNEGSTWRTQTSEERALAVWAGDSEGVW